MLMPYQNNVSTGLGHSVNAADQAVRTGSLRNLVRCDNAKHDENAQSDSLA